jgi:hypothetical protein
LFENWLCSRQTLGPSHQISLNGDILDILVWNPYDIFSYSFK